MYNHQRGWAEDDDQTVKEHVEKFVPGTIPFSLDDAFSETDDIDPNIEFSSVAIRADLARAASYSQEDEELAGAEESPGVGTTGDGDTAERLAEPSLDIPSPTLEVKQLYAKFDSISLSSPIEEKSTHAKDHDDVHNGLETTVDQQGQRYTRNSGAQGAQPATTNLEEFHSDPVTPDASQKSPPLSPPSSVLPPDTPTSGNEPEAQPGQTAHERSTSPSLSPPSSALPPDTPTSGKSETHPGQTAHERSNSLPHLNPPSPGSSSQRPPSSSHKSTRSTGPSMLEKVISKTRPSYLPPKSRFEDQKHLSDWERMMKQSRIAEEKRRKELQERRLARELQIEQSLYMWEKEILPDWKIVHRNPTTRKLWWAGIPTKLRATMWERAVGNSLALSQDAYRICLARAKRALSAGTFPTTPLNMIEQDIRSTLPSLHIFDPDSGPMYLELKDMLCAWVVSRSDEHLGYVLGTARIAAMIILNMSAGPGFVVMKNLLERHCMRSFYGGLSTKDDMEAYYRIFDTLLADGMPKIYFNFKQHQISPSAYLRDWIVPLFLDHLPFEACARLWDVILLEGDSFLYRVSLAILAVLESRLFFPDRQELLDLLSGENKAALEVARRENRPINGGKYEIYGLDEETLWDRLEFMNDWWKDSTWNRLLQRELPDI